ncbi:MAG: peptidoglycan editing factor PgeF [Helicobacteraceae bacterium]|nr:peptidoglycan editing factor PgeF [Helicobacteraceae bacterium]
MQLFSPDNKEFSNLLTTFTSKADGNLAFHVKDNPLDVERNHEQLSKRLGYEKEKLVYMQQVHSNDVHLVTAHDTFHTPPTSDALVTNLKNTPLMVMMADCSGLLFYDPVHEVIAIAHAGRAGAFSNIVKNVIEKMHTEFGSKPEDILVWVSASIGVCCYEVGEEIAKEASSLGLDYAMDKKEDSYYLDINAILLKQLLAQGISEQKLHFATICTACNTQEYYSYRVEGLTGRFAGVIMLRESRT